MAFGDIFLRAGAGIQRVRQNPNQIVDLSEGPMSPIQDTPPVAPGGVRQYTPEEQQSIKQVFAPYNQPPAQFPEVTQHTGGFISRLKDALVGTALGGPVGGIASLINPQLAHEARYNLIDKPGFMKDEAFKSQMATAGLNRLQDEAAITGRVPTTNIPTATAQHYAMQLQGLMTRLQQQQDQYDQTFGRLTREHAARLGVAQQNAATQAQRADTAESRLEETQLANDRMAVQAGIPLSPEGVQRLKDRGYDVSNYEAGTVKYFTDDNGVTRRQVIPKNVAITPAPATVQGKYGKSRTGAAGGQMNEQQLEKLAEAEAGKSYPKPPEKASEAFKYAGNKQDNEDFAAYLQRAHDAWQKKRDEYKATRKSALRQQLMGPRGANTTTNSGGASGGAGDTILKDPDSGKLYVRHADGSIDPYGSK